jgi:membrane-associated phospholipid phosphatase
MLRINPATDTNTVLLIRVARKIGEFVAMGLKEHFRMSRPAQVYPWIMPLIDGPDTPSYPSSHALQAHLISAALKLALPVPVLPPAWPPGVWPPPPPSPPLPPAPPPAAQTFQALDHLAYRVAYNREVAGVHYPMDSDAGRFVALSCIFKLDAAAGAVPLFQALVAAAAGELVNLP